MDYKVNEAEQLSSQVKELNIRLEKNSEVLAAKDRELSELKMRLKEMNNKIEELNAEKSTLESGLVILKEHLSAAEAENQRLVILKEHLSAAEAENQRLLTVQQEVINKGDSKIFRQQFFNSKWLKI